MRVVPSMKNAEVMIYGTSYAVKADADASYVAELARYVDEKMHAAATGPNRNLPVQKIAVLAAMNIADELHRLKTRQQAVEKMVHDRTGDLFDLLEGDKEP